MANIRNLDRPENLTAYLHLVKNANERPEEVDNLVEATAKIINANRSNETIETIKGLLLMVQPAALAPVRQLVEFVGRITFLSGLGIQIHRDLFQVVPKFYEFGAKFNFEKVTLYSMPESKEQFEFWNGIQELKSVREVSLDPNGDDYDDRIVEPLLSMPSLQRLELGYRLRCYGLQMPNLAKMKQLKELTVNEVTDEMTEVFRQLPLESLVMGHSSLTKKGFENLTEITSLKRLVMAMQNLHGDYTGISKLVNLREFRQWTGLPSSASLEELSRCPLLETLELSGGGVSFDPKVVFKMKNLKKLSLHEFDFEKSSWEKIKNLQMVEELALSSCKNLDPKLFEFLAQLPQLTWLSLSWNENILGYEQFSKMKRLRQLDLIGFNSPKEVFQHIAQAPLVSLNLIGCDTFGDEELLVLAERCKFLESIEAFKTQITDAGRESWKKNFGSVSSYFNGDRFSSRLQERVRLQHV